MRSWFKPAVALAAVFAVLTGPGLAVGAGGRHPSSVHTPLPIKSATLTQNAQEVIWQLQMGGPFSPSRLAHGGRSLCLVIERAKNGTAAAELCVAGPSPRGGSSRLRFMRITAHGLGPAGVISATITRTSTRELTATFLPSAFENTYSPIRWQVVSRLRGSRCVPPVQRASGCYVVYPHKPTLLKLHVPQLVGCVASGPEFVFNGPSTPRVVALTFDDGPWPDTPQFLSILESEHVPATFFEIGDQISTYGQGGAIERRMLADGDMVGDHTWNHADVAGAGSFAQSEIEQAAAAIRQATGGFTPCLLRAPYGAVSPALESLARSLGFTTIQWDIDPRDWARPGTSAIYNNVVDNAHPGAIILQHDGGGDRSETLAALPQEINTLRSEGYGFVTVTDLLGMKLIYK